MTHWQWLWHFINTTYYFINKIINSKKNMNTNFVLKVAWKSIFQFMWEPKIAVAKLLFKLKEPLEIIGLKNVCILLL